MNERSIVRSLRKLSPKIGDDCAILPNGARDLLVTTDQYIEDVHFRRTTHRAGDVGWNAVARGLSDIAAMGGDAGHVFISIALPAWANERWLKGFFRGAAAHGVEIAGGDLSHAAQLYCDVTVLGSVPRGKALRRDGAQAGDFLYVSGALGAVRKRFQPRLDTGRALRGAATSCMDLSDGLSLDLARLCEASGVGAELDSIPVAKGATLDQALHRGEDYELLFTSARRLPYPLIGQMVPRTGVRLQGRALEAKGYDHFSGTHS
jgi:thiamine-monophosphate kinase